VQKQLYETVVPLGEQEERLRHPFRKESLSARSTTFPTDEGCVSYIEGRDYVVDHGKGTIRRTPGSRMPDWTTHELFGKENFDHSLCKEYRNVNHTVYVDYEYEPTAQGGRAHAVPAGPRITHTLEKLKGGGAVRYVVFGDSISTGAEASRPSLAFHNLFAERLRSLAPRGATVEIINKAVGGERSLEGVGRLQGDVLDQAPDLVTITFGANDQCKLRTDKECHVPQPAFRSHMTSIVEKIRGAGADVVLITPLILNPDWMYTSGTISAYADILRDIARQTGACLADLNALWQAAMDAGKTYRSLLMNNINHPNDYGHQLYADALATVL